MLLGPRSCVLLRARQQLCQIFTADEGLSFIIRYESKGSCKYRICEPTKCLCKKYIWSTAEQHSKFPLWVLLIKQSLSYCKRKHTWRKKAFFLLHEVKSILGTGLILNYFLTLRNLFYLTRQKRLAATEDTRRLQTTLYRRSPTFTLLYTSLT